MKRALLILIATMGASCTEVSLLKPVDAPGKTVIYAYAESKDKALLFIYDAASLPPVSFSLEQGHTLFALTLDESPSHYHLPEGRLEAPPPLEQPRRPLPEHRAFTWTANDWISASLEQVEAALGRYPLPGLAPGVCEEVGGCFLLSNELIDHCELPCPGESQEIDEPEEPAPPAIDLPSFTPCPAGWTETVVTVEQVTVCEPPAVASSDCPDGQSRFLSDDCQPIGVACPAGEWPENLTDPIYVRLGSTGGDGSQANPYGLISEALNHPTLPGAEKTIALAKGMHPSSSALNGPLTIAGACAADTTVTAFLLSRKTVTASTGAVRLQNLRIRNRALGFYVNEDATLTLDGVEVASSTDTARGGTVRGELHATEVVLKDGARALEVTGEATLSHVVVDGFSDLGIHVRAGGRLEASDIVVRNMGPSSRSPPFEDAAGIFIDGENNRDVDTTLSLERALFERNGGHDLVVWRAADATISDIVIRESHPEAPDGEMGIDLAWGSNLIGRRITIRGQRDAGFWSQDGGQIDVEDLVSTNNQGGGFDMVHPESVRLTRALLADNDWFGLNFDRTTGDLSHIVVRNVRVGTSPYGHGIRLYSSDSTMSDVRVAGTEKHGLQVESGVTNVQRLLVSDSGVNGVNCDPIIANELESGCEVVMLDIETVNSSTIGFAMTSMSSDIRRLRSLGSGSYGVQLRGVLQQSGPDDPSRWGHHDVADLIVEGSSGLDVKSTAIVLNRTRSTGNINYGIHASSVEGGLNNVLIRNTHEDSRVQGLWVSGESPILYERSDVTMTRFLMEDSEIAISGRDHILLVLSQGEIRNHPTAIESHPGASYQLDASVLFKDNETMVSIK